MALFFGGGDASTPPISLNFHYQPIQIFLHFLSYYGNNIKIKV